MSSSGLLDASPSFLDFDDSIPAFDLNPPNTDRTVISKTITQNTSSTPLQPVEYPFPVNQKGHPKIAVK